MSLGNVECLNLFNSSHVELNKGIATSTIPHDFTVSIHVSIVATCGLLLTMIIEFIPAAMYGSRFDWYEICEAVDSLFKCH